MLSELNDERYPKKQNPEKIKKLYCIPMAELRIGNTSVTMNTQIQFTRIARLSPFSGNISAR
jgi:hypothetical protein